MTKKGEIAKPGDSRVIALRLSQKDYDTLFKLSHELSLERGKRVSMGSLLREALVSAPFAKGAF